MREDIYTLSQSSVNKELIKTYICGISYPDKNYRVIRNSSAVMNIEYVESGTGVVEYGTERFSPVGGDSYMLFIGENQHYWSDPSKPWKKYFINIGGTLPNKLCDCYKLSNIHHFKGLDIKAELMEIIELAKQEKIDHTSEILLIIHRIFYKMYLHSSNRSKNTGLAMKIRDYLDMSAQDSFNLERLTEEFSRSESQIIRTFKAEFGTTPYAYFIDKKTELAKGLLTDTNLLIRQISANLGFSDEYYFCNFFRKKTGLSPSQYRKSKTQIV